jgi:hypothetical protein
VSFLDPFPRPRVGRPVPHRFALPQRLGPRIPPTVLSRRREAEAQHGEPFTLAERIEAQVQRFADIIRQRLLDLRRGLGRFQDFDAWRDSR